MFRRICSYPHRLPVAFCVEDQLSFPAKIAKSSGSFSNEGAVLAFVAWQNLSGWLPIGIVAAYRAHLSIFQVCALPPPPSAIYGCSCSISRVPFDLSSCWAYLLLSDDGSYGVTSPTIRHHLL